MNFLVFDPSGNFGNEGMGTSGWALFKQGTGVTMLDTFGDIKATDFESQEAYFKQHDFTIRTFMPDVVVCESYKLNHGSRGKAQFGSGLETPQLIGYLRMVCYELGIKFFFQHPQDKARVTDEILTRAGVFVKHGNKYYAVMSQNNVITNMHIRDAIRHGIFFDKYNKGKVL